MLDHNHLNIHQREREGIVILDLTGNLVLGGGDILLREFLQSLFEQGNRQLILNLANVYNIDTSGAGALLFFAQEYRAAEGRLVLFQLAHAHGRLYEMARLEAALEIYGVELDAVNSFFPERAVSHYDILDYVEHHSDPEKKQ